MNRRKKVKLRVGDMVVKYDSGKAEQGILYKKQQPYFDQRKEHHHGAQWHVVGWDIRVLENFLKKK